MSVTNLTGSSSAPQSPRSRVSLALGLITLAGVGIVMVNSTVTRPLAKDHLLSNSIALAILIAISAIGLGLGLSAAFRTRATAGITGTIANSVSVMLATLIFVKIVVPDTQATVRSRGYKARYGNEIMATGHMWLPIAKGSSHTISFNPAIPNRQVFVEINGKDIDVVIKYRNGILATTASPEGIPSGSGDERLIFTPSTTEEHSIEIVPRSGSENAVIRKIEISQDVWGL